MDIDEFNDIYLNLLLDKISNERKSIFLLGDFNVDTLKYDNHAPTNEFLDFISSHMFLSHIIQPNIVTSNSKTLITYFLIILVQILFLSRLLFLAIRRSV